MRNLAAYHVTAYAVPKWGKEHGEVLVEERGIGSFLYSKADREKLKMVAYNMVDMDWDMLMVKLFPDGKRYYLKTDLHSHRCYPQKVLPSNPSSRPSKNVVSSLGKLLFNK